MILNSLQQVLQRCKRGTPMKLIKLHRCKESKTGKQEPDINETMQSNICLVRAALISWLYLQLVWLMLTLACPLQGVLKRRQLLCLCGHIHVVGMDKSVHGDSYVRFGKISDGLWPS